MTFARRLVLGTLGVSVVAIITLALAADVTLRRDLEADIRRALERDARLLARTLPADSAAWPVAVREIARGTGLRITLIRPDGMVVAESDAPVESLPSIENHAGRPEVQAALLSGVGTDQRESRTVHRPMLYVAVRGGPGVVRVATSRDGAQQIFRRAQRAIIAAALLALLLGSAFAFVAGRSIARPLTEITASARLIAAGVSPRFPRSGISDIDDLVQALRVMHQQLDERFSLLRQERAESAALVEAMVDGVVAADSRGRIVTANSAVRRLLGYETGEPLPALPQLFRAKVAREVVDLSLGGESVPDRELELEGRNVLLSGRPLPEGGALLVMHDVTALRRLETVRRDFVANVSHELKTPLTSISGYAETLVNDSPDAETTQRFLEVIAGNARRMQRLVDDLLDLSRIESGSWEPKPQEVDTRSLLGESWSFFTDRAERQGVGFSTEITAGAESVWADPEAVRQVLSNLYDNALRYTPPGGRISVRASREPGGVSLAVRDTGSGIPSQHLPRIFERFYRADPHRSRAEGGTGLGLSIVRHLVEAHGGRITAASTVGQGTEIGVWLPDRSETES